MNFLFISNFYLYLIFHKNNFYTIVSNIYRYIEHLFILFICYYVLHIVVMLFYCLYIYLEMYNPK